MLRAKILLVQHFLSEPYSRDPAFTVERGTDAHQHNPKVQVCQRATIDRWWRNMGAWCSAQIDAYLSEDGKSISVKGSAKGIISGNQGPENIVASPVEDDVVLDNTSYPSGNIRIYRNGSWIAGAAEDNTAYITVSDGHLWVATGSNLAGKKWTDCGQVKGDTGQTGYSIVASLTRNNFTEEQWETYDKERRDGSHTESWTYERINADGTNNGIYTSAIRNNCRIGDFFIIAGTATDTGNSHRLTYKSTTDAGNLVGYCVSHEIARAGTDAVVYQLCPMPGIVNFQRKCSGRMEKAIPYVSSAVTG